ncbi:MAG TPA: hypothetical protein VJ939_04025, partial [Bacteroidales bacterium]|nr:hypothetical protein [Bacteroidales bacterium]
MIKWFEKVKARRLIQKSVDNSLSENEKKELGRLLNKNPDLKQYHDSLYAIDQNLKNFSFKEGATDVSDTVMKKVMESKKHDESYLFPGNRKAGILYTSVARYVAAAVLGILVGVGSMILVSQNNMV